jgi:hypothetical protein
MNYKTNPKTLHLGHKSKAYVHHAKGRSGSKKTFLAKYGTKFAHGYFFKGKAAAHFLKYRRWDRRHHCYQWWCPAVGCWYYWYAADACYYPVAYTPAGFAWADSNQAEVEADANNDVPNND